MMKHENDEKFIPTIAEWGKLYNDWARKIAKSLWKWGSWWTLKNARWRPSFRVIGWTPNGSGRRSVAWWTMSVARTASLRAIGTPLSAMCWTRFRPPRLRSRSGA